jgi:hypothetical protein
MLCDERTCPAQANRTPTIFSNTQDKDPCRIRRFENGRHDERRLELRAMNKPGARETDNRSADG